MKGTITEIAITDTRLVRMLLMLLMELKNSEEKNS